MLVLPFVEFILLIIKAMQFLPSVLTNMRYSVASWRKDLTDSDSKPKQICRKPGFILSRRRHIFTLIDNGFHNLGPVTPNKSSNDVMHLDDV